MHNNMAETLLQKAQRLNIKPATSPGVTPAPVAASSNETLLQKAQRLGIQPVQTTEAPKSSGIGGFLKSLVSAPLTIAARPLEAVAELSGASKEDVDTAASKLSGGLVAPVPQNLSDVKKDVGRGVQTAAFGLGPLSGGAAFGFGNSLEQGNDVFSGQTALQTALGLGAGKVLDLVGKPLLNAAGKVIGKITPEVLSDVASKGSKAIQDFAATHNILPDGLSKPLNAGANRLENLSTKLTLGSTPDNLAQKTYQKGLQDASDTIYPKLTPTEKANVQLKDTGTVFKKSVPDLINDPKTKGLIESVSNLPEDIRVRPSDTLFQNEGRLTQGASRLHQDTDNYLYSKKAETTFDDAHYDSYMKENVLAPVIKEYGADSVETRATQDAIDTGKSLIGDKDAHGVYKARQEFQTEMKRKYPNAFKQKPGSLGSMLDPRVNARLESARVFRDSLNDFVGDLLPPNDPYRARLREESNLLRARDELRKRSVNQLDKNGVQRFLDRNPKTKKAVDLGKRVLPYGIGSHL